MGPNESALLKLWMGHAKLMKITRFLNANFSSFKFHFNSNLIPTGIYEQFDKCAILFTFLYLFHLYIIQVLKAFKSNFEKNMRQLEEELAGQLDYDDLNDDNENEDINIPSVKTPQISVNDSRSSNDDSSPSKMVNSNSSYSNNSAASSSDKQASPGPHTTVISVSGPGRGVENGDVTLVVDGEDEKADCKKEAASMPEEGKVNSQEQLTTM